MFQGTSFGIRFEQTNGTTPALEVLWVPGHCGLQDQELADEESKLGSAEHQPTVQLDCATRRAIIRRACSTKFISTPLHTATYPIIPNHREDILLSKPGMTHLRRFRSRHFTALHHRQNLINRSEQAPCEICNYEDETMTACASVVLPSTQVAR